jgi:hypothetical protein
VTTLNIYIDVPAWKAATGRCEPSLIEVIATVVVSLLTLNICV